MEEATDRIKMLERQVKKLRRLLLLLCATVAILALRAWDYGREEARALGKLSAINAAEKDPPKLVRRGTLDSPEDGAVDLSKAYVSEEARQAIRKAKVIAITEYEEVGRQLRPVLKEILWVAPGTTFDKAVGDEFGGRIDKKSSYAPDPGDSQVVFCEEVADWPGKGPPPLLARLNVAIHSGRLRGFKDMRLAKFRETVAEWRKESEKAAGAPEP